MPPLVLLLLSSSSSSSLPDRRLRESFSLGGTGKPEARSKLPENLLAPLRLQDGGAPGGGAAEALDVLCSTLVSRTVARVRGQRYLGLTKLFRARLFAQTILDIYQM